MSKILDPTEKGVWWRDNAKWERYSPESARKVLRAFRNGDAEVVLGPFTSPQHPSGVSYTVNLVSMKQTNAKTGFSRAVKIVSGPIDEEDGSDQDEQQAFSRAHGQQSTQSVKSGSENKYSRAEAGKSIVSMIPSVTVDLQKLSTQCRLEDQCNLVLKLPIAAYQSDRLNSLRKKTLALLLEKLTRKDFIEEVVEEKNQSLEPDWTWKVKECKTYILGQADQSESYTTFLSSLCNVAEEDDGFVDNLFGVAERGHTTEGDPVQYLFKSVAVGEGRTVLQSAVAPSGGFIRSFPPVPSERGRLIVYLAISKFLQAGTRSVKVTKMGSAIPLAQLVGEDELLGYI